MTRRLRRTRLCDVLNALTTEERFLTRYANPVLVLEPVDEDTQIDAHSSRLDLGATQEVSRIPKLSSRDLVHPEARVDTLSKSGRNAAAEVTAGRASSNDVVLPDASISKLHATFHETASGWTVTDRDSTNGTFVNGVRVPPGEARAVSDGMRLRFGTAIVARFFLPESFWSYCSAQREANQDT